MFKIYCGIGFIRDLVKYPFKKAFAKGNKSPSPYRGYFFWKEI
jgi:hypothetical protein